MNIAIIVRITKISCLFFISACSTFKVKTDFDTSYKFSESVTYVWDDSASQTESLSVQRFRTAIKAALFEKGVVLASSNQSAPLTLRLHVLTEDRKEVRPMPHTGSWGHWDRSSRDLYWHDYKLELFVVEFIQTGKNRIVWEGKASARVLNDLTPKERDIRAKEVARKLLKVFPPVKKLD